MLVTSNFLWIKSFDVSPSSPVTPTTSETNLICICSNFVLVFTFAGQYWSIFRLYVIQDQRLILWYSLARERQLQFDLRQSLEDFVLFVIFIENIIFAKLEYPIWRSQKRQRTNEKWGNKGVHQTYRQSGPLVLFAARCNWTGTFPYPIFRW